MVGGRVLKSSLGGCNHLKVHCVECRAFCSKELLRRFPGAFGVPTEGGQVIPFSLFRFGQGFGPSSECLNPPSSFQHLEIETIDF